MGDRSVTTAAVNSKPVTRQTSEPHVCEVCGVSIAPRRKFCKNGHKITDYRRRMQEGAKKMNLPKPAPKAPPVMLTKVPSILAAEKSDWTRRLTDPATKTPIRYGTFYEGTMLQRRSMGGKPVAPVYMGVDTLSLPERQAMVFAQVDKLDKSERVDAVVIDGVIYPKTKEGWHVWKSNEELMRLALETKGLPENEINFRMALWSFERAKTNLDAAFCDKAPKDDSWSGALKLCQGMVKTPENKRRIAALEVALKAQECRNHYWQLAKV